MSKVYLSKNIDEILEKLDSPKLTGNVAIKLHFGEKGCTTYLKPAMSRAVFDKVCSFGKKATLVECNVLYRGGRTNSTDHIRTAKENGFDFAPIDILDGENGQEFTEVSLNKGLAQKTKLGRGLLKYDSIIAFTHFTAHQATGFAGALKNLGMGMASRAGKLHIHSDIKPLIDTEKCTGCGICLDHCDADAIEINEKAAIIPQSCMGCAMCIAICPQKAVNVPWHGSTSEQLQKKTVDYAEAVIKLIKNKIIFINVLENITEDCDCIGKVQPIFTPDIGILISDDIVAIDKASCDLVNKFSDGKFEKIYSMDGKVQIEYADSKNLGSKNYQLINLDN